MIYEYFNSIFEVTNSRLKLRHMGLMPVSFVVVCMRAYMRVYNLVVCAHMCTYTNHNHVIPVQPLRVCSVLCVHGRSET